MPSVSAGRLRVRVIGAQTAEAESSKPYTVYRTVVTYDGECFERLLRYREFCSFSKKIKLRNSSPMKAEFPTKTWSRKALLDDDFIEARQVLLNEYMKEVSTKELTPPSEAFLMKLLRIGKYEDGNGRVSEMSSYKMSMAKSDRGTMDVVHEADEEKDKVAGNTTLGVASVSTLTAMTCEFPAEFPAVTSNATTVLADDERSAIGSHPRMASEEDEHVLLTKQDAIALDARATTAALPPRPPTSTANVSRMPSMKATSIPPSPYSALVLQKPALKSSQAVPGRRSRHVGFPVENGPSSAPATRTTSSEDSLEYGHLSPEEKYRERITNQLSSISRLLSDSDADTEFSSSRSATSNLVLTA